MIKRIKWLLAAGILFLIFGCASKKGIDNLNNSENIIFEKSDLKFDSSVKNNKLKNGMTVYAKYNNEPKNKIYLRLVVNTGSAYENDNEKGIAHFIEHLAFSGTKNFSKKDISAFFNKAGMSFGAEINAYASFEETVYMLEIPSGDSDLLKNSILLLHDWASGISFDLDEIENERKEIKEEIQNSQNLQGKITEKQMELLLKDSIYKDRLPIGNLSSVNKITKDALIKFYEKWYLPENMAIVAVGDIDEKSFEKTVAEIMKDIPASKERTEIQQFNLPLQSKKEISFIKDKEQKNTVVNIYFRNVYSGVQLSQNQLKKRLMMQMAEGILNERFAAVSKTSQSPWTVAEVGEYNITNNYVYEYLGFLPKQGKFTQALRKCLDMYNEIRIQGVKEEEFLRNKQLMLLQGEQYFNNRENISSEQYVSDILQYELIGKTVLSQEEYYKLYKKILSSITLEELNKEIKSIFYTNGQSMMILASASATDIKTEKEIMEIWDNIQ